MTSAKCKAAAVAAGLASVLVFASVERGAGKERP
jgi:hypothetical protein